MEYQSKKIGIVIPIYNAAAYLKECLDSVVQQTYQNFSVVLVNDGSTDDGESLQIAREYAVQDSRFILIDKKNGGQSTARNVGIEWFCNHYTTQQDNTHNASNQGLSSLIAHTITGDNPYYIHHIYSAKSVLTPEPIDYIIFLDSDDYWKPYCLEECVRHSNGVEIVWFGHEDVFEDAITKPQPKTLQLIEVEGLISKKIWLQRLFMSKQYYFAFAWQGLIDFNYLKNIALRFKDGVYAEDHLFGILLFLQSNAIFVLNRSFYVYRIRQNSSSDFHESHVVPTFFQHINDIFHDNRLTRKYYVASSWLLMLDSLVTFLQQNPQYDYAVIRQKILPHYIKESLKICSLNHDPLNLVPKIPEICNRLQIKLPRSYTLRRCNPKRYKALEPIVKLYEVFRKTRRKAKQKRGIGRYYATGRDVVVWGMLIYILVHCVV